MSGIYFHIPFCRKACHYCDFHFSTSLRYKSGMLAAMRRELEIRLQNNSERFSTVYFGGGTPSILDAREIQELIAPLLPYLEKNAEITLEANPDDLTREHLHQIKLAGINRLSIGVQSFFEEDLRWMNRSHNAAQAEISLQVARELGFDKINLDLIFGYPLLSDAKWNANIDKALSLGIHHLSTYSMTVENGTVLQRRIGNKTEKPMHEGQAERQYRQIMEKMSQVGWHHYEVSNFCVPGHPSRHNSAYWEGKSYLGIGPSAHGYDGQNRYWNVANNAGYIKALNDCILACESEKLSLPDQHNEYLLTRLRTAKGINRETFAKLFGNRALSELERQIDTSSLRPYFESREDTIKLNQEGFMIADHLISQLFVVK